jgi:microcystin-dependent protein
MPRPSVPALPLFGATSNPASEIGQFGSFQSPVFSQSLATIMSGTAWPRGWFASVLNNDRQFIQDQNAVDFVFCSYLFYIMTLGISEYLAAMTYWTNSICQSGGQVYTSLVDNNTGNTPASSPSDWIAGLPGAELSGVIKMWGGATAPQGYLLCQGQAVSRTTYATLFNVIGTQFGVGDGSTTFNIPNLQGNVPVGYKSGDPNFGTMGDVGGEVTHTLIPNEIPPLAGSVPADNNNSGAGTFNAVVKSQSANDSVTSLAVNGAGGGPHNNLQPFQVVNYIIKT